MALRNDVTVNFFVSPRIITVAAPSIAITVQDLYDTLRNIETSLPSSIQFPSLAVAGGKDDLGSGAKVGITLTLQNAKLAFEARPGPSFVQCDASGGNLVAVDSAGLPLAVIQTTSFTQVIVRQSSSPTSIVTGSGVTAQDKIDIADLMAGEVATELTAVIPSSPTFRQVLAWLYMQTKNQVTANKTTLKQTVAKDDGAVFAQATLADDGTTFTRGKFA